MDHPSPGDRRAGDTTEGCRSGLLPLSKALAVLRNHFARPPNRTVAESSCLDSRSVEPSLLAD